MNRKIVFFALLLALLVLSATVWAEVVIPVVNYEDTSAPDTTPPTDPETPTATDTGVCDSVYACTAVSAKALTGPFLR